MQDAQNLVERGRQQGRFECLSVVFIILNQATYLEEARKRILELYDREYLEMEKLNAKK